MCLAGAVMALAVWIFDHAVMARCAEASRTVQFFVLAGGIFAGAAVYFLSARLLGVEESRKIFG